MREITWSQNLIKNAAISYRLTTRKRP